MTACIRSVHEGCGTRRITVDGADDDLRNALAIASDGVHRAQSRALSVASRAGVSLQTRDKCGSGRLRLATDGPGPGERQERRARELRGWRVRCDLVAKQECHEALFPALSSPPRLPCRSPGPGPSVPSPSCPEPRLSRVSKLTPAHNTPHEAISCLFYPQTAPARTPTSHMIKHSPPPKHSPAQNEDGCFHRVPTHTLTLTFASVGSHVPSSKPR